jgi:hypothetical protein
LRVLCGCCSEDRDAERPVVGEQRSTGHEQLSLARQALQVREMVGHGLNFFVARPCAEHFEARRLDPVDVVRHRSALKLAGLNEVW